MTDINQDELLATYDKYQKMKIRMKDNHLHMDFNIDYRKWNQQWKTKVKSISKS